jgi:hypothetical protein
MRNVTIMALTFGLKNTWGALFKDHIIVNVVS